MDGELRALRGRAGAVRRSGGQRVLVYVRDRGRIKGSDTEINTRLIHVWTLTAGKIIRWAIDSETCELDGGCCIKPSRKSSLALAALSARAPGRDDIATDCPPATDGMAGFGAHR